MACDSEDSDKINKVNHGLVVKMGFWEEYSN